MWQKCKTWKKWGKTAENLPVCNSHLVIKPGEICVPSENHPAFLWISFHQYFVYLCGKTEMSKKCAESHNALSEAWNYPLFLNETKLVDKKKS